MNIFEVTIHWESGVSTYIWSAPNARYAEIVVRNAVRAPKSVKVVAVSVN